MISSKIWLMQLFCLDPSEILKNWKSNISSQSISTWGRKVSNIFKNEKSSNKDYMCVGLKIFLAISFKNKIWKYHVRYRKKIICQYSSIRQMHMYFVFPNFQRQIAKYLNVSYNHRCPSSEREKIRALSFEWLNNFELSDRLRSNKLEENLM